MRTRAVHGLVCVFQKSGVCAYIYLHALTHTHTHTRTQCFKVYLTFGTGQQTSCLSLESSRLRLACVAVPASVGLQLLISAISTHSNLLRGFPIGGTSWGLGLKPLLPKGKFVHLCRIVFVSIQVRLSSHLHHHSPSRLGVRCWLRPRPPLDLLGSFMLLMENAFYMFRARRFVTCSVVRQGALFGQRKHCCDTVTLNSHSVLRL